MRWTALAFITLLSAAHALDCKITYQGPPKHHSNADFVGVSKTYSNVADEAACEEIAEATLCETEAMKYATSSLTPYAKRFTPIRRDLYFTVTHARWCVGTSSLLGFKETSCDTLEK